MGASGLVFSIKGHFIRKLETLPIFTLSIGMSQALTQYSDSVQFPMFGNGGNRGQHE